MAACEWGCRRWRTNFRFEHSTVAHNDKRETLPSSTCAGTSTSPASNDKHPRNDEAISIIFLVANSPRIANVVLRRTDRRPFESYLFDLLRVSIVWISLRRLPHVWMCELGRVFSVLVSRLSQNPNCIFSSAPNNYFHWLLDTDSHVRNFSSAISLSHPQSTATMAWQTNSHAHTHAHALPANKLND